MVEPSEDLKLVFEKSIKDISSEAQDKFFRANFETLMGSALK